MSSDGLLITRELAQAAVYGGKFLGGGGGGSAEEGLKTAFTALEMGEVRLVSVENLEEDAPVVTASAVGAPAAREKMVTVDDARRVFDLYLEVTGEKPAGVITNENGGMATVNGWILAAVVGIPVVDAPCNGRAHPTAQMGSMGLSKKEDFITWQIAAGGNPDLNKNLLLAVRGSLPSTSRIVRQASVEAGGLVTVIRNRVEAAYLKENAAVGGITQAIEIGRVFQKYRGNTGAIIKGLEEKLDVRVILEGNIQDFELETRGGFDVGKFYVWGDSKAEVTFWNEYMTVEEGGRRVCTFPDLITVLSAERGEVLTSAELKEGEQVVLLYVPKKELKLGAGMFDKKLFVEVEKVINKDLVSFNF